MPKIKLDKIKRILAMMGIKIIRQAMRLKIMMNSKIGTAMILAIKLLIDNELKYQAIKGSVIICALRVSAKLSAKKRGRK